MWSPHSFPESESESRLTTVVTFLVLGTSCISDRPVLDLSLGGDGASENAPWSLSYRRRAAEATFVALMETDGEVSSVEDVIVGSGTANDGRLLEPVMEDQDGSGGMASEEMLCIRELMLTSRVAVGSVLPFRDGIHGGHGRFTFRGRTYGHYRIDVVVITNRYSCRWEPIPLNDGVHS